MYPPALDNLDHDTLNRLSALAIDFHGDSSHGQDELNRLRTAVVDAFAEPELAALWESDPRRFATVVSDRLATSHEHPFDLVEQFNTLHAAWYHRDSEALRAMAASVRGALTEAAHGLATWAYGQQPPAPTEPGEPPARPERVDPDTLTALMDRFDAGTLDPTDPDHARLFQTLVDLGMARRLGGAYAKEAARLTEAGVIQPAPTTPATD